MLDGRKALGRGLQALIQSVSEPLQSGVDEVPIDSILPNPYQPRHSVEEVRLQELAQSISLHGVLQPLIVLIEGELIPGERPTYRLIAGARRLEAAKLAGLASVPVVVKDVTPTQMLEMALVENIQRADLSPLEEASAYHQLITDFGLTQEMVAERVGRSRAAVANTLRLLNLPPELKEALTRGDITEGHARAILALPFVPQQLAAMRSVVERGLNVRQTEELVRQMQMVKAPHEPDPSEADTRALEEMFRSALGTRVNLVRGKQGGKIVIHFYSEEELQGLYDLLVKD